MVDYSYQAQSGTLGGSMGCLYGCPPRVPWRWLLVPFRGDSCPGTRFYISYPLTFLCEKGRRSCAFGDCLECWIESFQVAIFHTRLAWIYRF